MRKRLESGGRPSIHPNGYFLMHSASSRHSGHRILSRETVRCAGQIRWVLCVAGWDVDGGEEYSSKILVRGYGSGNSITLPNPSDILVEQCVLFAHSRDDGMHVLFCFDDFAQRCAASELISELLTTHIVSKSESLSPNDSDRVICRGQIQTLPGLTRNLLEG
jgi:hypothetical protein